MKKEQVDCRQAYSGGVTIVWPALFKEQQAGVVTKSSYTGAIHPTEAQLTPEACSLSLPPLFLYHIHTHLWVKAGNANKHVRQNSYTRINNLGGEKKNNAGK